MITLGEVTKWNDKSNNKIPLKIVYAIQTKYPKDLHSTIVINIFSDKHKKSKTAIFFWHINYETYEL